MVEAYYTRRKHLKSLLVVHMSKDQLFDSKLNVPVLNKFHKQITSQFVGQRSLLIFSDV